MSTETEKEERRQSAGTLSERAAAVRECDCGNCNNVPLGRPGGSTLLCGARSGTGTDAKGGREHWDWEKVEN